MLGQLGHNIRPHARFSPSFVGMNALMTSQLNVIYLAWVIGVLGSFVTCNPWCLYNQALANVRSTGAGIKYLYSTDMVYNIG